jgi:hypothetical protein
LKVASNAARHSPGDVVRSGSLSAAIAPCTSDQSASAWLFFFSNWAATKLRKVDSGL